MRVGSSSSWKSIIIGVWVFSCIAMLLIFGEGNPSKKESSKHLVVMNEDMRAALKRGGQVYSTFSNAKYGGALLYVNLMEAGWSRDLVDEYRVTLLSRGWMQRSTDKGNILLCKDGMLARIGLFAEVDSSRGQSVKVYGFSMKYGGDAVKLCERKS